MAEGKGLIVIPHTGYFPYQTFASVIALIAHTTPLVERLDFRLYGSSLIYEAREMAADFMLEKGHDWLFFLDSDMVPDPDVIQRLLAMDVDIASAMAFKRVPPYSPCFYPGLDYNEESGEVKLWQAEGWTPGQAEIQGVGMACCLIRRRVFEGMKKPRFFPKPVLAEDLAFCWRARQAGFKIYIDTTQVVKHVALEEISDLHFKEYQRVYGNPEPSIPWDPSNPPDTESIKPPQPEINIPVQDARIHGIQARMEDPQIQWPTELIKGGEQA